MESSPNFLNFLNFWRVGEAGMFACPAAGGLSTLDLPSSDLRLPTSDSHRLDVAGFRCTLAIVRNMTLDAALAVSVVVPE